MTQDRRQSMWDERYGEPGFAYGTEPNQFLAASAHQIPAGPVLSLGEGEGRNAVFLASLGFEVEAVDQSPKGLAKASQLARDRGVTITTRVADLADLPIAPGRWSGIVSIFCHLPPAVREPLYRAVVRGLRPGGMLVLEAYTPAQLGRGTGGPPDPQMLSTVASLRRELSGLEFVFARELEREVIEGRHHTGLAAVVQLLARRA